MKNKQSDARILIYKNEEVYIHQETEHYYMVSKLKTLNEGYFSIKKTDEETEQFRLKEKNNGK